MPAYNEYTGTYDMPFPRDAKYLNPPGSFSKYNAAAFFVDFQAWVKKHNIPQEVIDEWNRLSLASKTDEEQKNFWQRAKQKIKDKAQDVKDKVQDTADKARRALLMAKFKALKPVAKAFVKRKGGQPSENPEVLVQQVTEAAKKSGFGFSDSIDAFTINGLTDAPASTSGSGSTPIDPNLIKVAVDLLITIINNIKAKRAKGEELTEDEKRLADQIPSIEQNLNNPPAEDSGMKMKVIIAVLVLIALFFFLKR